MISLIRYFLFASILTSVVVSAGPAPDFKISTPSFSGRLSDLHNKVIYIDFWASWCSPCRRSFPWMNNLSEKYPEDDFVVIAVNVDKERQLADEFLKQVPAKFNILFDESGDIAKQYKVLGMPSSFLIDRNGDIRFMHTGFYQKKIVDYEKEISLLISEKLEAASE